MDFSLIAIIEAIILVSIVSVDVFVVSFAYGSNKIKIPFSSMNIINLICSLLLILGLSAGTVLSVYISELTTTIIGFSVLLIMGIIKLFDSFTKSIIRKYNNLNKELKFSIFNFKFILNLYANPEDADVDYSRVLSPMESVALAFAVGVDGLAVGFGAALINTNIIVVLFVSLFLDLVVLTFGCYLGQRLAKKVKFDLSWLAGMVLIVLAFFNLFW